MIFYIILKKEKEKKGGGGKGTLNTLVIPHKITTKRTNFPNFSTPPIIILT